MRRLGKELGMQEFFPEELKIEAVDQDESEISLKMYSYSKSCKCPKCGIESAHKHGTYQRKVQDLPILNKRTYLCVNAYEYQCDNPQCDVTTFAESMDGFLSHFGRMTERLAEFVCGLALETSCESCACILKKLNVKISGDTVIRLLTKRYAAQSVPECGNTVGIDDFAFKKRHKYGTIIVDEATHKTVAVLNGRDGASLKEWLVQNKHVTAVTRDRASAYAKAVEEVLPDCMQIADRFHLHQNLMDAVNKVLGREIPATTAVPVESEDPEQNVPLLESTKTVPNPTSGSDEGKKNPSHCG